MPEFPLMQIRYTEHVRMAIQSLDDDERRKLLSWLDHLANWKNDSYIRSKAEPLKLSADQTAYALRTSTNMIIVFTVDENAITVLSAYRKEAVDRFAEAWETAKS